MKQLRIKQHESVVLESYLSQSDTLSANLSIADATTIRIFCMFFVFTPKYKIVTVLIKAFLLEIIL